jgi:hypothetical protein
MSAESLKRLQRKAVPYFLEEEAPFRNPHMSRRE